MLQYNLFNYKQDCLNPIERKQYFLGRLSSSGKNKYKRYIGTPLRYAGGKSLAVGLIIELIPDNIQSVVSPFIGGGSVEVACANELKIPVFAYDIFDILVDYWQIQLNEPSALYHRLSKFKSNRAEFKKIKNRLKKHWYENDKLGKRDLAAHYYFNHNTSYGPHFLGWPSNVYLQRHRYKSMIEKVRDFRAHLMNVHCLPFEDSILLHKKDFLYCDPPYYLGDDSKTFVGMYPHRNFPIHHKGFKHELLREYLLSHRGGFILSYNDCPTIRKWYSKCNMIAPSWQYTFGQGDTRIGENRAKLNGSSHIKKSHELIIWKPPK